MSKRLVLLLLITILSLAACGSQPSTTSSLSEVGTTPPFAPTATSVAEAFVSPTPAIPKDTPPLRIVTSFQIKSMNPIQDGFWMPEFGIAELMMQFRADGKHYPWLLDSIEQIDQVTWRLTLRKGITFQNGNPLNAAALAALINRQLALSPSAQSYFVNGSRAEAIDELNVIFHTEEPTTAMIPALADEAVFPVYDVSVVEAVGENYEQLIGAGIYTGPYQVLSLNDQEMILERNPTYWQGLPALPGVLVRFVTDPQARILAVQNDEADIALYPPTAAKAVIDAQPGVHFNFGTPSTGGFRMVLNIQQVPFSDMAVRQAIIRAIDYEELANDVMDGVFLPATGYFPPFFDFAIANQRTDVTEAERLLEASGWKRNANGVRTKDGKPLRIVLLIYPQQPDLTPISEAIQAQLARLGFMVEIRSVDNINNAMRLDSGVEWHAGLVSAGPVTFGGAPEPALRRYFVTGGDRNYAGFSNAELDSLTAELSVTFDNQRRRDILRRLQEIIIEEEPYQFFVNFHTGRVVVNDRYRDYRPGFALLHVTHTTAPSR